MDSNLGPGLPPDATKVQKIMEKRFSDGKQASS